MVNNDIPENGNGFADSSPDIAEIIVIPCIDLTKDEEEIENRIEKEINRLHQPWRFIPITVSFPISNPSKGLASQSFQDPSLLDDFSMDCYDFYSPCLEEDSNQNLLSTSPQTQRQVEASSMNQSNSSDPPCEGLVSLRKKRIKIPLFQLPLPPRQKRFTYNQSLYYKMKSHGIAYLEVKSSEIHGLGIFTKRHLEKNEFIIDYTGEKISIIEANRREKAYDEAQGVEQIVMFALEGRSVIDPMGEKNNIARRINHSCQPNCIAKKIRVEGSTKIVIIANKEIPTGTELTLDFKLSSREKKIKCNCHASKCRRYIDS